MTVIALLADCGEVSASRWTHALPPLRRRLPPHAAALRPGRPSPTASNAFTRSPALERGAESAFRPAARSDRHAIFRLYCRAVEMVTATKPPTQQEFRAVLDSFDTSREVVRPRWPRQRLLARVGIGDHPRPTALSMRVKGGTSMPRARPHRSPALSPPRPRRRGTPARSQRRRRRGYRPRRPA